LEQDVLPPDPATDWQPPIAEDSTAGTSFATEPATQKSSPEAPVSLVEARRATRRAVRRKLNSPPPVAEHKSHKAAYLPAVLGFAAAMLIGVAGWALAGMLRPAEKVADTALELLAPESEIIVDGQRIVPVSTEPNPIALTSLPQKASVPSAESQAKSAAQEADVKKN
jgi:hypothetical protein